MSHQKIQDDLKKLTDPEKGQFLQGFFKTGPGEYGEGDKFWGIKVPDQRKVSRKHWKESTLEDVKKLLSNEIHEVRLTGLFVLVAMFKKADEKRRKLIYDFYLENKDRVNNWDLVDSSAHFIVGAFLENSSDRDILYQLAKSESLWDRRIAMISCYWFIKKDEFDDALKIAEILVMDEEDLIQKAVGWMLREIGKRDQEVEEKFLMKYYTEMPRTMLRYAIEKFEKDKKDFFMGRK